MSRARLERPRALPGLWARYEWLLLLPEAGAEVVGSLFGEELWRYGPG